MFQNVLDSLHTALEYWKNMQETAGDEGAEWANIFERHFYLFIDEFEKWFHSIEEKPQTIEKAEALPEIEYIESELPGPLQLNFLMELERILDGLEMTTYD
ncbi:hypothetical protein ACJ2A9_03645 [Anaerobacillus sp. MEB173]|uniref:hypothetical protein n=1 Tax=Anaerobacillus sp. MEB173 TaxID=3383345 RepID=UPI003F8EB928